MGFTLLRTFYKTNFYEDGIGVVPLDFENKLRYELSKGFVSPLVSVHINHTDYKIFSTPSYKAKHKDPVSGRRCYRSPRLSTYSGSLRTR